MGRMKELSGGLRQTPPMTYTIHTTRGLIVTHDAHEAARGIAVGAVVTGHPTMTDEQARDQLADIERQSFMADYRSQRRVHGGGRL